MNKLSIVVGVVLGFVAGAAAFYATNSNAGIWGAIATSDWPTKDSNAYKVSAFGFDFRVYEWQTDNDPNTVCTVAIGNVDRSPYMGLDCFKK